MELVPPGFTALVPGFGPFVDWIRRRDFGVHARVVDVRDGDVHWDETTRIPVTHGGAYRDGTPARLDQHDRQRAPRRKPRRAGDGPGARILLPIAVEGALFSLGDCHAVQGDGELCGIGAIEIRTHTTVRLDVAPRPGRMTWPRIESVGSHWNRCVRSTARGRVPPLSRGASELDGRRLRLSPTDAVLLLGQVAEARCTQLANPKYTYITKIAKRYLH